jgi:hypothetical protein
MHQKDSHDRLPAGNRLTPLKLSPFPSLYSTPDFPLRGRHWFRPAPLPNPGAPDRCRVTHGPSTALSPTAVTVFTETTSPARPISSRAAVPPSIARGHVTLANHADIDFAGKSVVDALRKSSTSHKPPAVPSRRQHLQRVETLDSPRSPTAPPPPIPGPGSLAAPRWFPPARQSLRSRRGLSAKRTSAADAQIPNPGRPGVCASRYDRCVGAVSDDRTANRERLVSPLPGLEPLFAIAAPHCAQRSGQRRRASLREETSQIRSLSPRPFRQSSRLRCSFDDETLHKIPVHSAARFPDPTEDAALTTIFPAFPSI